MRIKFYEEPGNELYVLDTPIIYTDKDRLIVYQPTTAGYWVSNLLDKTLLHELSHIIFRDGMLDLIKFDVPLTFHEI